MLHVHHIIVLGQAQLIAPLTANAPSKQREKVIVAASAAAGIAIFSATRLKGRADGTEEPEPDYGSAYRMKMVQAAFDFADDQLARTGRKLSPIREVKPFEWLKK